MRLLIATRSPGKTREIRQMFAGTGVEVVFPDDLGLERLPEEADLERHDTYAANAVAKARYFGVRAGMATAADDSGIEVDALGGAPGIYSARFTDREGGEPGPAGSADAANNALLLERLRNVPTERRTARYRCVVAYLADPGAAPVIVEATCEGRILPAPQGSGGFGYDPLFHSLDLGTSFGLADPAAKHAVSHRGRAFRALLDVLQRTVP